MRPFTKAKVIENYFKGLRNSRVRAEEYCWSRMEEFKDDPVKTMEVINAMREIHNFDVSIEDIQQEFYRRINNV